MREIVIDANGLIVGRLAAYCAKKALLGYHLQVFNIEKAVISGNPKKVVEVYRKRRQMTNAANPAQAAKWPRRPDILFKKRILKGMLPFGQRGRDAVRRVTVHISGSGQGIKPVKDISKLKEKYISLGEVCKALGWSVK